ncbi:MAG: SUMF1/EgtB/PvdO family nonheme iron enzyme [Desulfobacterales bacterium]|nr:SUMF1/EgtB/PvdO family nonheme iron enzyme [Desulfobacterales bacterium]
MLNSTVFLPKQYLKYLVSILFIMIGVLACGTRSSSFSSSSSDSYNGTLNRDIVRAENIGKKNELNRYAIIIGNSDYIKAPLKNSVNDANSMEAVLKEIGFDVVKYENCNQKKMKKVIDEFGRNLKNYDVGLFFYAGHGVQVGGNNYLIPIDVELEGEDAVDYDCVRADRVLSKMEKAETKINIVILDACRNNPFERSWNRGTEGKGLAFMNAPSGSLIAYATSPGKTASDSNIKGNNGLYTSAILQHIKTPDIKILDMFERVRSTVIDESGKQQIPWEATSLTESFYFIDKSEISTTVTVESDVTGAEVRIDGVFAGNTPVKNYNIKAGNYRIVVIKEGYESFEQYISVEAGLNNKVYARLSKLYGKLSVDVEPSNARVKVSGISSFSNGMSLLPGEYSIEISANEYKSKSLRVYLKGGEDKTLNINLERKNVIPPVVIKEEPKIITEDYPSFTNSIGQKFVYIKPGTFMMGSPPDEKGRYSNEVQHQVTLTKGFYMQTTEVTQGQWKAVMGNNNPSYFKDCGDDCPVEQVSWNDCQDFIKKLNQMEGKDYRLPTEAEWEYAARAGSTTAFSFGDCLSTSQANYDGNYPLENCPNGEYRVKTIAVESFLPNAWGLYDMHGNVYEWCSDWYGSYSSSAVVDPTGASTGSYRVIRGGRCYSLAQYCRSADRSYGSPSARNYGLGARLARTP